MKAHEDLDVNSPLAIREIRRVGRVAYRLAQSKASFSRTELLTRALESAPVYQPSTNVVNAINCVVQAPDQYRIQRIENAQGQTAYSAENPHTKWKAVRSQIEYVFADHASTRTPKIDSPRPTAEKVQTLQEPTATLKHAPPKQEPTAPQPARASTGQVGHEAKTGHESNTQARPAQDWHRKLEKVLRSYEVIGAVGQIGLQVAAKAIELYQLLAKPVWRVHGNGHKNIPGSVAAMVRDLKKLPYLQAQEAAFLGMFKLNGTLEQKLRYGEFIYRQSRKPKFRIPRKSLIVVTAVEEARPRDVKFLLAKAKRAKAKVIFVEREWSRSVLMEQAKTMKPGEARHLHTPEHKR